jgi:outer membrane protein OmpA-like peptidoglycan-associated protein
MRRASGVVLAALAATLLAACSSRPASYVVLLDNPDGHASELTLANAAGSSTLDRPGQAIGADSGRSAPGEAFAVTADEIRRTFGAAIDRAPPPPLTFTLYFKFDLPELTDESRRELPAILAAVGPRPAPEVAVIGHTDQIGPRDLNYQLGLRRAEMVRQSLLAVGLDDRLIQISSFGDRNPALDRPGRKEDRNRRVEVIVR